MICQLNIVSIEKNIFSGVVKNIQISGSQGELGIYPGHSPLLTSIKPGILYFLCQSGKKELFYISGGVLEVQPNIITVLADMVIPAIDLDLESILQTKTRAEKNINKNSQFNIDKKENIQDLSESLAKLRVIKMMEKLT